MPSNRLGFRQTGRGATQPSALNQTLQSPGQLANQYILATRSRARYQFYLALGCLLAYIHAIGNPNQVGVLELDPGPLVAIVEQHIEPCRIELGSQLFA